jgi:hypothetical protein
MLTEERTQETLEEISAYCVELAANCRSVVAAVTAALETGEIEGFPVEVVDGKLQVESRQVESHYVRDDAGCALSVYEDELVSVGGVPAAELPDMVAVIARRSLAGKDLPAIRARAEYSERYWTAQPADVAEKAKMFRCTVGDVWNGRNWKYRA